MNYRKILEKKLNERKKVLENFDSYLKKIKEVVKSYDKNAKVFLFGSFLDKKKFSVASDIDVLIKIDDLNGLEARGKLLAEIKKAINFAPLFEFHLANEKEFEWYRRFVKKFREI